MQSLILTRISVSNGSPRHTEPMYTHVVAIFQNPEARDKLNELICHEQPKSVDLYQIGVCYPISSTGYMYFSRNFLSLEKIVHMLFMECSPNM